MFDIPRLPVTGGTSGDNSMGLGVPELVLESNGQTWTLDPSRPYTLGRDPQGDIVFTDARVSWRHATVRFDGRGWVLEDHGSTNGTFVHGRRIHRCELDAATAVHLGNATDGPLLNLSATAVTADPRQAHPEHQPYAPRPASYTQHFAPPHQEAHPPHIPQQQQQNQHQQPPWHQYQQPPQYQHHHPNQYQQQPNPQQHHHPHPNPHQHQHQHQHP